MSLARALELVPVSPNRVHPVVDVGCLTPKGHQRHRDTSPLSRPRHEESSMRSVVIVRRSVGGGLFVGLVALDHCHLLAHEDKGMMATIEVTAR